MARSFFSRGEIIEIDRAHFRIVEIIGDKFQLRSAADGALRDYTFRELLRIYECGRLKITNLRNFPAEGQEEGYIGTVQRSLADFPEPVRNNAIRKWKYLNAICPDGKLGIGRQIVDELLNECAKTIEPIGKPPSAAAFYVWRQRWVIGNFDIRALIDRWELRGCAPKSDYPQQILDLIVEGIDTVYLTPQRETKKELRDWICGRIHRLNMARPPEDRLPLASARLINRMLDQYDRYHVLKKRYGERIARQSLHMFGRAPECVRPLQRVEVDNTPLDILVIDEATRMLLGRPWITVMIDRYSRMVVGIYVSFRRPSVESILRCLRHAILPKTYLAERYPAIQGEWPCFGLVELLVCDNGLEFHAKDLEAACADIGTHIAFCEPRAPYLKGAIERYLKTLNYGFTHFLPGTTHAKYDKRFGYDSERSAVLTFGELDAALHRWIVDVYGAEFHRGIQACPLQKWGEGAQANAPQLVRDPEHLKVYLGRVAEPTLDRNGIRINSLQYVSDELQSIRSDRKSMKVTIRFDPDDLGTIYVLDPHRQEYISAPCTDPEYANGLTLEQHTLISKKARLDYAALPYRARLLAAKLELREFTDQLLQARKLPRKGKIRKADDAKTVLQQYAETPPKGEAHTRDAAADSQWIQSDVEQWILNEEIKSYDIE
ncbi:transposase [Cupriavidus sp. M-11]|uniref:transposase n=1 Tax=Cupriavidus sp. M-11 TaxID=3233038 RepID=UPI003F9203D0